MSDTLLLLTQSPFEEKWYKLSIGSIRASILTSILETYGSMLHTHDNLSVLNMLSVDGSGKLLFNGLPVGGGGEHVDTSDFVTLSTAQTVTGDKTFASDVIPGGQKTDGTRGRLFLPSSLGTGAVDIFVDTETGVDGETPVPGAGGNAAWEVSTHRAHAVLNVSGERKELALYGHRHAVSEISGLLGTDGLILSSLLPSVQSPVTSVAGLTGDITVSALRDALTDTDHLFVTSAEKSLWTSKWTWSEEAVKAVKVNNAVNADRLGGVLASDYVRTAALEDFCEGYLKWGALPQDKGSIQVTNGLGQSRSVSLHGHHHAVSDVDTGDGWDALLGSAAPSTLSGWGIKDAYTKNQVSQILGNYLPLAGGRMLNKAGIRWATGGMTDLDLARDSGLMIGYAATDTSSDSFPDGVGYLSVLSVLPSIYGFQIASTVTDNELYFRRQGDYSGTSWSAWKKILDSSNVGSYALTPSNYTSTLDGRYALTAADNNLISHSNEFNFIPSGFSNKIAVNYRAKGGNGSITEYTFYNGARQLAAIRAGNVLINGHEVWHSGNDGSGSGLDADLLDGTQKSGLLTSVTSTSAANLSVTVGGTVKSVADLYATYLGGKTLAETRRGMSFLTSSFTAAGWYRVYTSLSKNSSYTSEVILHIDRTYNSPQNENYSFSICVGYNGDISITQLSGVMGGHLITKIRVVWDNSQIFHIDIYSAAGSGRNTYGVTGQGYGTFYAFTPNATIPGGYTAYEFATVDGCKSDRGFTGTLSGNATSATKLQTSRTLWGQSFNGTGNVSGDMTGVGSITGATFSISGSVGQMFLYNNTSKNDKRLTLYSQSNYAAIYNITADGSAVSDLILGNNINALYYDASANRWGIGTTSPTYKLHVIGSGYFSSTLKTASELNANTVRISSASATAHLAFGRANYNYITAPSGGGIAFVTNGKEVSGDNTDMYVGDGRVSVGGSLSSEKLFVPSSLGNEVFDIYVDTEVNVDGEVPVSGGGLDVDSLWTELSGSADGRVIAGSHIPLATASSNGGIRTGYSGTGKNYPVELDSSGRAYVNVPWVNTTYSLSSFGITATAAEINKLDGLTATTTELNYVDGVTSSIQTQLNNRVTLNTAQTISGLKTFARDAASVLFVENTAATSTSKYSAIVFQRAGSNIGIIAAGVDTNYLYRANPAFSTVYTILDTGNYASTLDSRYVNISGDTMTGDLTVPRLVVRGTVTGNSTRYIYSGATDNIYMSVGGVVPLVARPECVRRGASAASVTLGTSTYPWADTYTKKLHITDTSSAAHLSFGRTDAFNYISLPGADSTLAIAPGGNISGAGSALCISNSATYPGYSSGTRSLGTSSYRWSSVYSVAGNFSGNVSASGTVSGDHFDGGYISNYNTDRTYWVGDATRGISSSKAGLLLYSYGSTRNVYVYTNGSERMVVNGSGNVGIGTTAPAYKLDVSGEIRAASGITIGSTDDYGWYIGTGTRISAGISAARGVNVGSLLVSNAWADYSKVPENGIYSKGEIVCSSDIYPDVTASVKLGSAAKRWLGVYAQNGSFSGNVSVSSLNVVTEATVKTLVPDKLHLPSSLGNDVFDIYVDTEVNVDGETPVSVSFQPQWYGWINADGTAAKQGGSATLTAVRTAAGTLRLNGIAADSTVIAVPATFITGSTASPRTTASVLKSGSVHYVQTYNNAGIRANLAFYLLVI